MTSREKMVENNLGLVHSCAAKFKNRGVDYEDLFQAGCVGLLKAVDGFDESLGFVFSMMVYWNATANTWSAVRAVFKEINPNWLLKVYSEEERSRALSTFS